MRPAILALALFTACAAPEEGDPARARELFDRNDPDLDEQALAELAAAGLPADEPRLGRYTEELGRSFDEAVARHRDAYQDLLRSVCHSVRRGCLAREWNRLRPELRGHGFREIEIFEPDDFVKHFRLLARRMVLPDHDLVLWLEVRRKDVASPWLVRAARAGLHSAPHAPPARVAGRYAEGTLLDRLFALKEVQKLAERLPVVEELEILYDPLGRGWGFHVNAAFVGAGGGKGIYYTAEDRGGELGPLQPRVSHVWGNRF